MPHFVPPRHDRFNTIQRALNLGVNIKMITCLKDFKNDKDKWITNIMSISTNWCFGFNFLKCFFRFHFLNGYFIAPISFPALIQSIIPLRHTHLSFHIKRTINRNLKEESNRYVYILIIKAVN
ncbi:putative P-type H(+)-exporting transporter [Helianthus anomalus]